MNNITLKNSQQLVLREAVEMIKCFNIVGGESNHLLFGKDEFVLTEDQEVAHIKRVKESHKDIIMLGIIDNEIVSVSQLIGYKSYI